MSESDGRGSHNCDSDAARREAATRALRDAGFTVIEPGVDAPARRPDDGGDDATAAAARRWQATLDAVPHAVLVLDGHARVSRCNDAARALLGARHGTAAGAPLEALVRAAYGPPAAARLAALVAAGAPASAAAVALGERWFDAALAQLPPGDADERVLTLTETTALHAHRLVVTAPREEAAPPPPLRPRSDDRDDAAPDAPPAGHGALARVRVLALDADRAGCELLASALRRQGAEVVTVATVGAALAAFARRRPDVLVAAVGGGPDADGVSLVREIRTRGAAAGGMVPAVALTEFASASDTRRALLAGFQMHASRCADPSDLVAKIAKLVAWSGGRGGAMGCVRDE